MVVKLIHNARDANSDDLILGISVSQFENVGSSEIFRRVVEIAAEKYVSENYAEIVKHLDQRAIATLALARASQMTAESAMTKNIADATDTLRQILRDVRDRQNRI